MKLNIWQKTISSLGIRMVNIASRQLTRAEFAAIIGRFAKLRKSDATDAFPDLEETHWAYDDIPSLSEAGLLNGYEDEHLGPKT